MKRLLVLGAGTAGTMVVNKLSHLLDQDEWQITIVDQNEAPQQLKDFEKELEGMLLNLNWQKIPE